MPPEPTRLGGPDLSPQQVSDLAVFVLMGELEETVAADEQAGHAARFREAIDAELREAKIPCRLKFRPCGAPSQEINITEQLKKINTEIARKKNYILHIITHGLPIIRQPGEPKRHFIKLWGQRIETEVALRELLDNVATPLAIVLSCCNSGDKDCRVSNRYKSGLFVTIQGKISIQDSLSVTKAFYQSLLEERPRAGEARPMQQSLLELEESITRRRYLNDAKPLFEYPQIGRENQPLFYMDRRPIKPPKDVEIQRQFMDDLDRVQQYNAVSKVLKEAPRFRDPNDEEKDFRRQVLFLQAEQRAGAEGFLRRLWRHTQPRQGKPISDAAIQAVDLSEAVSPVEWRDAYFELLRSKVHESLSGPQRPRVFMVLSPIVRTRAQYRSMCETFFSEAFTHDKDNRRFLGEELADIPLVIIQLVCFEEMKQWSLLRKIFNKISSDALTEQDMRTMREFANKSTLEFCRLTADEALFSFNAIGRREIDKCDTFEEYFPKGEEVQRRNFFIERLEESVRENRVFDFELINKIVIEGFDAKSFKKPIDPLAISIPEQKNHG